MRVISSEQLREKKAQLISRRKLVATSAVVGTALGAGASITGAAAQATPDASPVPDGIQRNPWEPAWSEEPAFFQVLDRNEETILVESLYDGEQEIPANAENIFLMSGEEDSFLALGLEDRILGIVADVDGVPYYTNQALFESRVDTNEIVYSNDIYEPDIENIIVAGPDLILGQGAWILTDELYPTVSQIAPTLRYPYVTFVYPRRGVQDFGALFDREEAAAQAIADYNDTMQRAREKIMPIVGESEVLVCLYWFDSYVVYPGWYENVETGGIEPASSVTSPIHMELGLKPLSSIEAEADKDRTQWMFEVSAEQFGSYDPDYLFIAGDPEAVRNDVLNSPVVQRMRAVQNNNVIVIDDTGSLGAGFYGNLAQVSAIVEAITGEPFE